MRRIIAIVLILLALVAGGLLLRHFVFSGDAGDTDGLASTGGLNGASDHEDSRSSIIAQGTIEPRNGIVHISSPLIGYAIQRIHVREGQVVKRGDPLIELDPAAADAEHQLALTQQTEAEEQQKAAVALAKDRVAAAQLAIDQATKGRDIQIASQEALIQVAASKMKQAESDVGRLEELRGLSEPLASDFQVEQQRLLVEAAKADHHATQMGLERLKQTLDFQQQTAQAELRAAQQALIIAEKGTAIESVKRRVGISGLRVAQTKVTAPSDGVILGIAAHPGEVIAQQPLLQMANLEDLVCVAEVDAADVPNLQPNQKAYIACRAFRNKKLEGTVEYVGNLVAQASLRPLDPRRAVDHNVVKVVVPIDARAAADLISSPNEDRRDTLVGLQVEVEFPLNGAEKLASVSPSRE